MLRIEIQTDNDAFARRPASESCRILKEIIARLKDGELGGNLRDINGNTVGRYDLDNL